MGSGYRQKFRIYNNVNIKYSVAEPEPPGAATFRAEPEPIFFGSEPGAGAACFKAAPAASFRQAKKQGCGSGSAWLQEGKFVN